MVPKPVEETRRCRMSDTKYKQQKDRTIMSIINQVLNGPAETTAPEDRPGPKELIEEDVAETMIPGPQTIPAEVFADLIMASLKKDGISFDRAIRILDTIGDYVIMPAREREEKLAVALGTWRSRELPS